MRKTIRVVLILLLGVLAWLILMPTIHPALAGGIDPAEPVSGIRSSRIVWLNPDTINEYYLGFQDVFNKEGKLLERIGEAINKKAKLYDEKFESLERESEYRRINFEERIAREKELNNIAAEQDEMQRDYDEMEMIALRRNDSVNTEVKIFLAAYARQNHIDCILMTGPGSMLEYANEELEITQEIVLALNTRHRMLKK